MEVSVEALGALERRLTIIVPSNEMDRAFDDRITTLAKKAKVPGFRPGKVPLSVIKQQYGHAVRQEALSELIQSSLTEAIRKEKLTPATTPQVEPKVIAPNKPLEFVATFEIFPSLTDLKFDPLTIEKEIVTVSDEDVDFALKKISSQWTGSAQAVVSDQTDSADKVDTSSDAKEKQVTVEEEVSLPEKLGLAEGGMDALRAEIRTHLEREAQRIASQKLKNQVFSLLLEQNSVEVPKGLVEQEAGRLHNEACGRKESHSHSVEEKEKFYETAKRNTALGLIVAGMAEQYGISADEARVQEFLTKIAASFEDPTDVIRWYRNNQHALNSIRAQVAEEMLVEKLLENAKLVEKAVSYRELIGDQS